jgi:hypothetical protein
MDDNRLSKIAANSSQNHHQLKNHWGIQEEFIMGNIDNITNIITSKFKENRWCDKELVDKMKLR